MTMMLVASVLLAPIHASATDNNIDEASDSFTSGGLTIEYDDSVDSSAFASSEEITFEQSYVENAVEAQKGIVQINCVYNDDSGSSHIIKGCTGFVVGTMGEDKGSKHILTCKSAIIPDTATKKAALRSFGVKKAELNDKMKNISYEVVVTQDMTVSATIFNESEKLDLIVFNVSDSLANKIPLSIYTSDDDTTAELPYKEMDAVHALGLPDAITYDKPAYYGKKDIGISSGIITNLVNDEGTYSIAHTAIVGDNNCGGPLVNDEGNVIGMNVAKRYGQAYEAIDSTELVDVLESFGIGFNKLSPENMGREEAVEEVSVEASTIASTETDDKDVPPVKPVPIGLIIALVIVSILLIAALVAVGVMVYLQSKPKTPEEAAKRAEEKAKKKEEKAKIKSRSQELAKPFSPVVNPMANINQSGGTGMETNALSAGSDGGTTLLSNGPAISQPQGAAINGGTLIRKKTGDNIIICKPVTTIGKDSLHVDYCIRDNSAISRIHASVKVSAQGVFIEDRNSTNGTFVNGVRLGNNETKLLSKGDIIRLGNEEFEYRK